MLLSPYHSTNTFILENFSSVENQKWNLRERVRSVKDRCLLLEKQMVWTTSISKRWARFEICFNLKLGLFETHWISSKYSIAEETLPAKTTSLGYENPHWWDAGVMRGIQDICKRMAWKSHDCNTIIVGALCPYHRVSSHFKISSPLQPGFCEAMLQSQQVSGNI